MAPLTMELGKKTHPSPAHSLVQAVGLKPWGKEAVDPGLPGLPLGSLWDNYMKKKAAL